MSAAGKTTEIQQTSGRVVSAANLARVGQRLFGDGNYTLTPGQIADLLKLAGIPVPKDVQIGLAGAQVLMAGGQICSAISTGASIGSWINPANAELHGIIKIGELMGWLDPTNPAIGIIELGVDIACVVSAGGANVMADIQFALDLANQIGIAQNAENVVRNRAYASLNAYEHAIKDPQRNAAAINYTAYQSGQLSLFEFIGAVASQSPDLFYNFFPSLGGFLPTSTITACFNESTWTLFGGHRDYTACDQWKRVQGDQATVQRMLLQHFVFDSLKPFIDLDIASQDKQHLIENGFPRGSNLKPHPNPVHRISVHSMALLSLFPPYPDLIPMDFNIIPTLVKLDLTPSDLDASPLLDEINASSYGSEPSDFFPNRHLPPDAYKGQFTGTGTGYLNGAPGTQVVVNDSAARWPQDPQLEYKQKILDLDNWREFDSTKKLMKIPEAYWIMREWGSVPFLQTDQLNQNSILSKSLGPKDIANVDITKNIPMYRFIRNYWGALAMLDKIMKDKFFNSVETTLPDMSPYLKKLNDLEAHHKDLQFKVTGRRLNKMSLNKIASFFGTTSDKIYLKTNPEDQTPAIFGVKQ